MIVKNHSALKLLSGVDYHIDRDESLQKDALTFLNLIKSR